MATERGAGVTRTCRTEGCGKQFRSKSMQAYSLRGARHGRVALLPVRVAFAPLIYFATRDGAAVSELVAAVDLTRQGFSVFRAISPACSCDLIAMLGSRILRVEVRTASPSPLKTGRLNFAKNTYDEGRSDTYAVVRGNDVFYQPPLAAWIAEGEVRDVA